MNAPVALFVVRASLEDAGFWTPSVAVSVCGGSRTDCRYIYAGDIQRRLGTESTDFGIPRTSCSVAPRGN